MSFAKDGDKFTDKAFISVTLPAGDEKELATILDLPDCWRGNMRNLRKNKMS